MPLEEVDTCTDCGNAPQQCEDCNRCEDCGCECTRCGNCNDITESLCERCEHCSDCCECRRCRSRRSHLVDADDICSNCEYCSNHCECYCCDNCSERVSSYCDECERCDDCGCHCNGDEGPRVDGKFQYFGTATKDMPRYTSLELEYAGCSDGSYVLESLHKWRDACVADGSLPDAGFEINTNPTRGDDYAKHIGEVCAGVRDAGTELSRACGLHVHVDARDLNWHDLYKLALLYRRVEDAVFKMQPRSRQDNNYCLRVEENYELPAKEYKHRLLSRIYGDTFPKGKKEKMVGTTYKNGKRVFHQRGDKYNSARYYAMNLHTFFYRGTIEFRHAASTANTAKATNWGLVCMWIVEKAAKMTVSQINALPKNSTEALQALLPTDLATWVVDRQKEQGN